MISQAGKVSFENYKTLKGRKTEEVEGKEETKEVDVTLRFDFVVPIGTPFETIYEVIDEIKKEVEEADKKAKERSSDETEEKESIID